ncbi:coproporphyrinogen dehydrogenase HemZ [Mogibacterium pumilum]|uniref:Coproporphyrinogen dehydrogenase HemZ n=1 Tax=Mogibacterium pumilum TaxID=86332 RepID=A0A223ASV1_9FIRM|nr:coproporphyrinogen dehydrogenase HemZ [Mogibacterium pumilum]ASS38033.1 coproporphyrinogen dehydrogenase HemZ [Mogibacterium pumilum]
MYRLYVNGIENEHHYSELAREFFADGEYEVIPIIISNAANLALGEHSLVFNANFTQDRDIIKREMFKDLSDITGKSPDWGTLTGVKPLKPAMNFYLKGFDLEGVDRGLADIYLVSDNKRELIYEILSYQTSNVPSANDKNWAIYTSIPFCPSICSYCSFGSELARDKSIEKYLPELHKEIYECGKLFRKSDKNIESVYFGGGTPTSLNGKELKELFNKLEHSFDIKFKDIETTVEAGRPDTIDEDRLEVIKSAGVNRISINPQSMNDETLKRIGRSHSSNDIRAAFRMACEYDFEVINSDVIACLPGETTMDVENTIHELIDIGANNITVHTLSVKRGSKLKNEDPEYYLRGVREVEKMLSTAANILHESGFVPYYVYRQKHQMGSFENTGWCKPGLHSLYNIRIMEELQTIIGLGAGAIGKRYYPAENRLERVPNINDYRMYVDRIDNILARKHKYFD